MFSSSTRKWRRERVDKAEMGSAPNIVDVSPCFEALLAVASLIMIFPPKVSSVFQHTTLWWVFSLTSCYQEMRIGGNCSDSPSHRETHPQAFLLLCYNAKVTFLDIFLWLKTTEFRRLISWPKKQCVYAYIYRFLKAFGGKCMQLGAAQVLPENIMKCHFFSRWWWWCLIFGIFNIWFSRAFLLSHVFWIKMDYISPFTTLY